MGDHGLEFSRPLLTPLFTGAGVDPGCIQAVVHEALDILQRAIEMLDHHVPSLRRVDMVQGGVIGVRVQLQTQRTHFSDRVVQRPTLGGNVRK